jgi:hypothetical protein
MNDIESALGLRKRKPANTTGLKDVGDVVCCVVDSGLFIELAAKLAETYKKVYYCTPGPLQDSSPKYAERRIGYGFDGLERCSSPFDPAIFDTIDLYVFPDVHFGPEQVILERLGKAVWGMRMAEEFELFRDDAKKKMEEYGLAVAEHDVVTGTKELREFGKEHEGWWVKLDTDRGTSESFELKDSDNVERRIEYLDHHLGPFKNLIKLNVEAPLPDKVETGIDTSVVDGQFPVLTGTGIEIKDKAYLMTMRPFSEIPEPITRWATTMASELAKFGSRGSFSTETRIGKDMVPYDIDLTMRRGSPPTEIMQELVTNTAIQIWLGANGILVEPEVMAKYGAEVFGDSEWSMDKWQDIEFPAELKRNIKFMNCVKIDGKYSPVPLHHGVISAFAVIGWGKTPQAAIKMVKDVAKEISSIDVVIHDSALDDAEEEMAEMAKMGLDIFA